MEYTVQEVADLVGKTRQTIYSYLDSGKLSFTLSDNNTKLINASEVLRVFPEVASKIAHIEKEKNNINVDLKVLELQQELTNKLNEIERIRQELTFEKEKNELLNRENRVLNDFNETLKKQLPDLTNKSQEVGNPRQEKKGFFKRLFR
ncbi:hypothetical protein GKC56_02945 [Neisseriaceae bacterium PsAf]|nr:hypothetical protein [Neisseriaceae bacterium PsAf]